MLLVSLTKCNSYVDNDCSSLQTTRDNLRTSENHCANYRVAVDSLVGQGWERKRPTLS